MTTWHIFYDNSTKLINWSTNALVDDTIIAEQASAGLSYLSKETEIIPSDNDFWVNDDGTDIVEKSIFNPTFSTVVPSLDDVIDVTGVPSGTEVWLDSRSQGTMSDTTLTLTATEPGKYEIKLTKTGYKPYTRIIRIGRLA